MANADFAIEVVADSGDSRGASFPVSTGWLTEGFMSLDAHVTTIRPGCVRGNHYHVARREVLVVLHDDCWSVHWDTGSGSPVNSRRFTGSGCVLLQVPPMASHAIRNDGRRTLHVVGLTDGAYDPAAPDTFARKVVDA